MMPIAAAQSSNINWKRKPQKMLPHNLFHSLQAANLPTSETISKDNLDFEISHRLYPAVADGYADLFGFDGPANMRLALGYGISNKLGITLGRTNINNNLDLTVKWQTFGFKKGSFSMLTAVQGGTAWNSVTIVSGGQTTRKRGGGRNFQYWGQFILNGMIGKKLGLGLVPSYLHNSDIFSLKTESTTSLGSYLQFYFTNSFSVLFEWNPIINGYTKGYNPAALGLEFETGGHFFKIIMGNSVELNPAQYISGSDYKFEPDQWRLGFYITRVFNFRSMPK